MAVLVTILAVLFAMIFVEAGLTWPYVDDPELEHIALAALAVIGAVLALLLYILR